MISKERSKCSLIVVVEDDEAIREVLQSVLKMEGYRVRVACNGKEAVALLKTLKKPCLILTDLMMPIMNGYEFIELASKTHTIAAIPIVIVSATLPHEGDVKIMTDSGKIKGLIKKPINMKFMMSIVHKYCGPAPRKALKLNS